MFSLHTIDQHTDSLAAHLPSGKAWLWKAKQSNGRDFLRGLSYELFRNEALLKQFWDEIDPRHTTYFLEEWESAVGIPDECFDQSGSLESRRLHVMVKLASLGVQTAKDFEHVASILGLSCVVKGGIESGEPFGSDKEARFTIVIYFTFASDSGFPWAFPHPFTSGTSQLLGCLFEHLKPVNCNLLIKES